MPALQRGSEIGADVVQVFAQSPRAWKPTLYSDDTLRAYRETQQAEDRVQATFGRVTRLVNLAAADHEILNRSRRRYDCQLCNRDRHWASGLVLHLGSHRGRGLGAGLDQVVEGLLMTLSSQPAGGCPLVLENTAGCGDTVGRRFEELAAIIEAAGNEGRLGFCLDTQHL